jgi:DNA-binding NarL/FixJ family response regulator
MVRIVLMDDHALIREGIKTITSTEADLDVVGETGNAAELMSLVDRLDPDVCVVDLMVGDALVGLDLTEAMRAAHPRIAVLVVSMHEEFEYAERAFRAGALGYLPKSQASDFIVAAIRAVSRGEHYLASSVAAQLAVRSPAPPRPADKKSTVSLLTSREREILHLYGEGLSVKHVAAALGISASTVGTHSENIKHKMGVVSMAELMRVAYELDESSAL